MVQVTKMEERGVKEKKWSYLRQLYVQHIINLQKLQEQAAVYPSGQKPLCLLNQIEAEEQKIKKIIREIEELEDGF